MITIIARNEAQYSSSTEISSSQKRDLTVDFANWFGSANVQTAWMNQFGTIPCQPKALDQALEDIKNFISQVHPQDMD